MIFNKIVTAYRAPLVSTGYGERRDWGSAEIVFSGPGSLQYRSTDEQPIDSEIADTEATIYLRTGDFEKGDRVLVDGEFWEVVGEPLSRELFRLRYVKVYVRRVR